MNHNLTIGSRIKALRTGKKYTLKQLSEESGLSIGFLSQVERGMSSIAIDSLATIANILEVSLSSFFNESEPIDQDPVMHSFDMPCTQISSQIIQYILSKDFLGYDLLPRLFHLMPFSDEERAELAMYNHAGEEFIYVLEGIVTVYIDDRQYTLYPGDSTIIQSNAQHNWINLTSKIAKLLSINYPNPFKAAGAAHDPGSPINL